jgi:hypothetical protein
MIDDLADLSTVEVEQDGRRALLRTAPRPSIDPICRALGISLPPVLQPNFRSLARKTFLDQRLRFFRHHTFRDCQEEAG